MKRLILCALLIAACSNSGQKGQIAKAHDSKFHYGDTVKIVDGMYSSCSGTVGSVTAPDDSKGEYLYSVLDLQCTDSNRHEHSVQDIPEKQISK